MDGSREPRKLFKLNNEFNRFELPSKLLNDAVLIFSGKMALADGSRPKRF